MATPHTVIDVPPEQNPSETTTARPTITAASTSWVPSWFPGSPLRPVEKSTAKQVPRVGFEEPEGQPASSLRKPVCSTINEETSEKSAPVVLPLKERATRHESISGQGANKVAGHKLEEQSSKRKSKAAPPPPVRTGTLQSNFSYDTLKERADVWKKERSKRPPRPAAPEREDSFVEKIPDRSRKSQQHPEFLDDISRPKIRFTQDESDKVDKDILRLMGALEDSRYPFNRDKHLLFNKLRLIRRKQMGLLFAHRELDGTGYFDTDREEFGYDVISDQLGTMYNVIDAISRDVYELREMLYYERKNQTPPTRRGSSDRRTSSEPPPTVHISQPVTFPTRTSNTALASFDGIDGVEGNVTVRPTFHAASTPHQTLSPTRPILKHSTSNESFKSAKSDDTVTD